MAYLGQSFHTLDAANRLIIPARFREALGNEIVVYKAIDGCLFLYDQARFSEITQQLSAYGSDPLKREQARLFYADVTSLSVDRSGRIVLPADCLEHAHIASEVALLGADRRIELWDKDTFAAKIADKDSIPADMYPAIEL